MKIQITGKNIDITQQIRDAIESDLSKLDKYFKTKDLETRVVIKSYNIGEKVEITININKDHTLRQEVTAENIFDAISLAATRIERQLRKFKDRLNDHNNQISINEIFQNFDNEEEKPQKIIKRKKLENKLMTEEEALLQFELLGHDFFIFEDADEDVIKVIYKRKDNSYGIIETE